VITATEDTLDMIFAFGGIDLLSGHLRI
jgi:hypothetical protein